MINIPKEELQTYYTNITHKDGYRIVYYYEKYHEVPSEMYAKNIKDYIDFFNTNNNKIKFTSIEDIVNRFLDINKKALGAAIYSVKDYKCIYKKIRENTKNINNSEVYKEELIYDHGYLKSDNGYRIVFFFKDDYRIGPFSLDYKYFMRDFTEFEPIIDDDDIPTFISIDDLLKRYLASDLNATAVALYKTNGECISIKNRTIQK